MEKVNNVQGELFDIDCSKRVDHIVSYTRQILKGIEAMHTQDILHGDVKLENALVAGEGVLL